MVSRSTQMTSFLESECSQRIFTGKYRSNDNPLQGLDHVFNAGVPPVDFVMSPGQQEALEAINSSELCTVIQGPPGTGKTFIAAVAISARNHNLMKYSQDRGVLDVTLFVTETNSAALNIAVALEMITSLRTTKGFKLVFGRDVPDFATGDDTVHYDRLKRDGLIWTPLTTSTAQNWKILKGTRVVICTVVSYSNVVDVCRLEVYGLPS
jgi:hypothetical protein